MPDGINPRGRRPEDYLAMAAQKLGLGGMEVSKNLPVSEEAQAGPVLDQAGRTIGRKELDEAITALKKYKDGKSGFESRILEEEKWWRLRHWDVVRGRKQRPGERPEPTSAWLFNSLANKHADIMDNFPEPNVLPREQQDEQDAKMLSSILPVIFERCSYEETYSDAAWYKLKHGVSATGVFWGRELEDGLGDVDVQHIDMLSLFWEPGITNLQDSRNLFIVALKDNDLLEQEWPQLKGRIGGQVIDVARYANDDQNEQDTSNKSVVVDWYYKRRTPEGKTILHFCKFCGTEILFSTENDPQNYPNGLYDHGRYPVELDVLYPEEGTPTGFGLIAIMKDPQLYIDKLGQVILENAVMRTNPRYFAKKTAGINREQFLDQAERIVDVEGDLSDERLRPIEVPALDGNVLSVLQMKIDELKETSSNRDVNQGSTSGSVTAAAAISALQEAGNKSSRDMISSSYRSYRWECYMAIELIRQYYTEARSFRITGELGYEFVTYSNAGIVDQALPPAYPGQEKEEGYVQATRRPIFDIIVKPQKRSPYSKMAQNELAKELYGMGAFDPRLAEQTLTLLELMDFDGIEKVRDRVQKGQTLLNQLQSLQQTVTKMGMIILKTTGEDVLGLTEGGGMSGASGQPAPTPDKGKSMGSAVTDAMSENMTSYGQKLAQRAVPSLEGSA